MKNINFQFRKTVVESSYADLLTGSLPAIVLTFFFYYYAFSGTEYVRTDLSLWVICYWIGFSLNTLLIIKWRFSPEIKTEKELRYWERLFAEISVLGGIYIGYIFYLLDLSQIEIVYSAIALLAASIVISVLLTGYSIASHLAYVVPLCLFLGINFFGTSYFNLYLIILILCFSVSIPFVTKNKKLLRESLRLRFEKDVVVSQLSEQIEISEQANLAKTKFLAAASHDLRQPLQSVSLLLAALFAHLDKDKQKDILNRARGSLDALNELLESLLDISKLDAGVIHVSKAPFDIQTLITQEIEKHRAMIESRGLSITHVHSGDLQIYSDPILVSRILSNLISNAEKYSDNGSIEIESIVYQDQAVISVKDNGRGIPEKNQTDIFTEFYQLENPERDRTKGLGLGLSIVKRLSSLLGGSIDLDSKVGVGSAFTLTLTQTALPESMDCSEQIAADINEKSDLKLFIIDDEITIRESMQLLLESWGCQAWAASDLDSARTTLKRVKEASRDLDALIVDYRLRENVTGLDCIYAIRQELDYDIPALIITGDTAPERVKELENSGVPFIHKPVNTEELRHFLAGLPKQKT